MKIRYIGDEQTIELAIPGACLTFPKGEWIDGDEAAEAAGVPAVHMEIIYRGLVEHPHWELKGALSKPRKSAARRRPARTKEPATEPDPTTDDAGDQPTGEE